jgi:predicted transcriptional regulator
MRATVKITPRVAEQVARRLRLAASIRSSSMSRLVNDALDEALPSLEEIRMQLAAPAAGEADPALLSDIAAPYAGPVVVTTTRGPTFPGAQDGGTGDGGAR